MRTRSRGWGFSLVCCLAMVSLAGCTGSRSSHKGTEGPGLVAAANAATPKAPAPDPALAKAAPAPSPEAPREEPFAAWLAKHLPAGGRVVGGEGGAPVSVVHTATAGQTPLALARAYLDVVTVYTDLEYAEVLMKANPFLRRGEAKAGEEVQIPSLIAAAYKTGDDQRLGWPEDRALRGVFMRNDYGAKFPVTLGHLADRDMNAIVLDGKDYEGYVTYPTKAGLAVETEAAKHAPLRDLARTVRFAHEKGIRVIMRNSCFHDPWMAKQRPKLSVQSKYGGPYKLGWVDPSNEEVQAYILEVVEEQLAMGVDEIQLDYIRYPVVAVDGADFHLTERGLTQGVVVRDFVRKVHAVTQKHKASLSLDVFGVVAFNRPEDVVPLGQDLAVLGAECEALSPMVYPSHFARGFHGFDEPGQHPEVIGIATKATVEIMKKAGLKTAIRPWLQAFTDRSPNFGPAYIATEAKSATTNGSTGWLMWHPGGDYGVGWAAIPKVDRKLAKN